MPSTITYAPSEQAWKGYEEYLTSLISKNGAKRICDIGGGANPVLSEKFIADNNIDYTLLDISSEELAKAPASYNKVVADITDPNFTMGEMKFDFVFSKMLAEHVKSAKQFHSNVAKILSPEGVAMHFFPTLFTFPFLVNRIIPESFASSLLTMFANRNRYTNAKFPAYYQWCRGPIASQFKKLDSVGLEVVEYIGFFGHKGYYRKIPIVRSLHKWKTALLLKRPVPLLTSYAYLVVKRKS